MTSKRDTLSDPVSERFTYNGWTFVGIVPLPDYYAGSSVPKRLQDPICEARFISDGGEKMGVLLGEHCRPWPIWAAMNTVSEYEWKRMEARLSAEYARMC